MDFDETAVSVESTTESDNGCESRLPFPAFGPMQVDNTTLYKSQYELSVDLFIYRGMLVLLACITTFGNLVVIVSQWREKQLTQCPFKTCTFSLATSDLLVGVAVLPFSLAKSYFDPWPFGTFGCALWKTMDYGLPTVSILIMMALGVDRYRSVTSPLLYRCLKNRRRTLVVSVTSWLVGFALWIPYNIYKIVTNREGVRIKHDGCSVFQFKANRFDLIQIFVGNIIPIVVMITLYAVVVRSVRRRLSCRGLSPTTNQTEGKTVTTPAALKAQNVDGHVLTTAVDGNNRKGCRSSSRDRIQTQNLKCYKSVTLIVSAFLVCVLPFTISWSLFVLFQTKFPSTVDDYLGILFYVNSVINPFIVMRTQPKIRNNISCAVKACTDVVNLRLKLKH